MEIVPAVHIIIMYMGLGFFLNIISDFLFIQSYLH